MGVQVSGSAAAASIPTAGSLKSMTAQAAVALRWALAPGTAAMCPAAAAAAAAGGCGMPRDASDGGPPPPLDGPAAAPRPAGGSIAALTEEADWKAPLM